MSIEVQTQLTTKMFMKSDIDREQTVQKDLHIQTAVFGDTEINVVTC